MRAALIDHVRERFRPARLYVLWGAASASPPLERFASQVSLRWEWAAEAILEGLRNLSRSPVQEAFHPAEVHAPRRGTRGSAPTIREDDQDGTLRAVEEGEAASRRGRSPYVSAGAAAGTMSQPRKRPLPGPSQASPVPGPEEWRPGPYEAQGTRRRRARASASTAEPVADRQGEVESPSSGPSRRRPRRRDAEVPGRALDRGLEPSPSSPSRLFGPTRSSREALSAPPGPERQGVSPGYGPAAREVDGLRAAGGVESTLRRPGATGRTLGPGKVRRHPRERLRETDAKRGDRPVLEPIADELSGSEVAEWLREVARRQDALKEWERTGF